MPGSCSLLLATDLLEAGVPLLGQPDAADFRGPGGYLAWYKLLLITMTFLVWVRATDWINRDGQRIGKDMDLWPELWNPISLVSFLIGFWSAVSIPVFWVGFPVMLLFALGPLTVYFLIRRAKLIETPTLRNKLSSGDDGVVALPQDVGPQIVFSPAGESNEDRQKNLIRARRAVHFTDMKKLIDDAAAKRAEVVMLDYTRDRVNARWLIDGVWHALAPMSREVGDSILSALKTLAGLNADDRRSRQSGTLGAKLPEKKLTLEVMAQGVKTGERVQLKLIENRKSDLTLPQLGMWPDMIKTLASYTSQPGLVLVTAPPRNGLTTSWRAVLGASDRITRDWVALIDKSDRETDVENVHLHVFDSEAGQTANTIMRKVLLSQPDAVVISDISDRETLDKVVHEANHQERTVVTRVPAKSAAEGLVRLYAAAGDKSAVTQAVRCVIGQRLARRLCDACKVPIQVQPQMIKKLGGDPRKTNTLYKAYKLPPPEQRVDENGKPIEMLPCKVCSGIGYIGRIAVFEMIRVTPQIRESLQSKPDVATIRQQATGAGDLPMLQQGYRLVLMGITTVNEIQRIMKN